MDIQPMTVRFPRVLYERLRYEAFEKRVPMSQLILEGTGLRLALDYEGAKIVHKDGDPANNDPANLEIRERNP